MLISLFKSQHIKLSVFLFYVFALSLFCRAAQIDPKRYITVSEVKPGMDAYCLTVLDGEKVEKFPLKVLSVISNHKPGLDVILVAGTDEKFIHAGAVQGCSGSPVFIEGRMAGALAYNLGSMDPLYLVTPIEYMLRIGSDLPSETIASSLPAVDISGPLDLAETARRLNTTANTVSGRAGFEGKGGLSLFTSLPATLCSNLSGLFSELGFCPVAAGSLTDSTPAPESKGFEPGGVLAIPLISGDISASIVGTVTEVAGDKVYGFGHNFLGYGAVDLPMAHGVVHTVVASRTTSFKLASAGRIEGAIRFDESTGVLGSMKSQAKLIPLTINVTRYNDSPKTYHCRIVCNRMYTPMVLQIALAGAAQMRGPFPPEHKITYSGRIEVAGYDPIIIQNVSSQRNEAELITEAVGIVTNLMNNPYRQAEVTGLEFNMDIEPQSIITSVRSIELSDIVARPGQTITITAVTQTYLGSKTPRMINFTIPADIEPGDYQIFIAGPYEYENFLRKNVPHRYVFDDLPSMLESIKNLLSVRRDRLYLLMNVPGGGVTIQRSELPDLPETKAIILRDPKRSIAAVPYQSWLQQDIPIGGIVPSAVSAKIKVER